MTITTSPTIDFINTMRAALHQRFDDVTYHDVITTIPAALQHRIHDVTDNDVIAIIPAALQQRIDVTLRTTPSSKH